MQWCLQFNSLNRTRNYQKTLGKEACMRTIKVKQFWSILLIFTGVCILNLSLHQQISVAIVENASYEWPQLKNIQHQFNFSQIHVPKPERSKSFNANIVGKVESDYFVFYWGPNKNPIITDVIIQNMLKKLDFNANYLKTVMGYPVSKLEREGYRNAIFLYGSGLTTDTASNTENGAWQSWQEGYPMMLISYMFVKAFDPNYEEDLKSYYQNSVTHEYIHTLFRELPGFRDGGWLHESANDWLIKEMRGKQTGAYENGPWLDATSFLAPFTPIESLGGWLRDGSFAGPHGEGKKRVIDGVEVSMSMQFLGGYAYNTVFPTFLSEKFGEGSLRWVWQNCDKYVLSGIANAIGDTDMRRLITEYRAKQALVDMGKWSGDFLKSIHNQFGRVISPEDTKGVNNQGNGVDTKKWTLTPYVRTTHNGSGLITPDRRTLPGWSGANQIPLKVKGKNVKIKFLPKDLNMTMTLCYRAEDGSPVYSQPVGSGFATLALDKKPFNDIVIAVITNTDYVYEGEATRNKKSDYQIQLESGAIGTADIYQKWFEFDNIEFSNTNSSPMYSKRNLMGESNIASDKTPSKLMNNPTNNSIKNLIPNPINIPVKQMTNGSKTFPNPSKETDTKSIGSDVTQSADLLSDYRRGDSSNGFSVKEVRADETKKEDAQNLFQKLKTFIASWWSQNRMGNFFQTIFSR